MQGSEIPLDIFKYFTLEFCRIGPSLDVDFHTESYQESNTFNNWLM